MHSALVVVEKPAHAADHTEIQKWSYFVLSTQGIGSKAGKTERLGDNVFLIPLQNDLPELAEVLAAAAKNRLHYRVLILEKPPEWAYSHPTASPAEGAAKT